MPVSIDHTAHPYLLDLIISYAPLASLLQLRATSRGFRERVRPRVERLLSRHLILTRTTSEDGDGDGLALYPPSKGRADPRWHIGIVPSTLVVLDVDVGEFVPHELATVTSTTSPALRTLRRFNWPTSSIFNPFTIPSVSLGTVVDFVDLSTHPPLGSSAPLVDSGVTRHVLHVRWDTNAYAPGSLGTLLALPSVHEFVLALWPFSVPKAPPPSTRVYVDLCCIFNSLIRAGERPLVTVVGLEHVDPNQITEEREVPFKRGCFDATVAAFREELQAQVALFRESGHAEEFAFECITFEEWHERLGDDKDDIGVWPEEWKRRWVVVVGEQS
ncbi:uncharacterized protein LOC62_04G005311 [Vanrija pseudolonga]|uniref:F-box domain-containing protein n=1 Tax=Vanrija pseudolonga TaxID=143232 RepID=A0AAF0Y827_9TREE|nr:hypothetical protein LOC62_04G005311 [Vanrija pseudolonga]